MKHPKLTCVYTLILACIFTLSARSYDVAEVPNVHAENSSRYVSDPDGILTKKETRKLDNIMGRICSTTSAEAVIVIVGDIEDNDIENFATQIFDDWGIGKDDVDNGLLIVVVKDLHEATIRTGYGLEGLLPDVTCNRLMKEYMIPEFKNDDYGAGLIAVATEIEDILTQPEAVEEIMSKNHSKTSVVGSDSSDKSDTYLFIGVGVIILVIVVVCICANKSKKCPNCNKKLKKVEGLKKKQYLTKLQALEQKLHTADYQVYVCSNCGETVVEDELDRNDEKEEFLVLNGNTTQTIKRCSECGGRTCVHSTDKVVEKSSVIKSGRGIRVYVCQYCSHNIEEPYEIPSIVSSVGKTASELASKAATGIATGAGIAAGLAGIAAKKVSEFLSDDKDNKDNEPKDGRFGGGKTGGGGATTRW